MLIFIGTQSKTTLSSHKRQPGSLHLPRVLGLGLSLLVPDHFAGVNGCLAGGSFRACSLPRPSLFFVKTCAGFTLLARSALTDAFLPGLLAHL